MKTEIFKNYLWAFQFTDIDNNKLYKTCCHVENHFQKNFPPPSGKNIYGCLASYYHREYNLFSFPCSELSKLYKNMTLHFSQILEKNTKYYIRCWANIFKKGNNIDWHKHWDKEFKTYHGFYCVNTEGKYNSHTDYKIPHDKEKIYRISSRDGLCVIGKSEGDLHRSSEWLNDEKHRITIAFDVIPLQVLRPKEEFTHELLHNYFPLID